MIFGSSLIKEVDPPAISKMGPTFPKVAERGPKCKERPRCRIWSPWAKVRPQYTYRVFLSRLGRGVCGETPQGGRGWGGGKPPPVMFSNSNTQTTRVGGFWFPLAPFWHPWLHFGSLWLLLGAFEGALRSPNVPRATCNAPRATCNAPFSSFRTLRQHTR